MNPGSIVLDVKLLQEQVKQKDDASIILPIMLTVRCKNGNGQGLQQRLPVDLIFVIDVSGSMDGDKLKLLKQSLIHNLEILNDNDRLGIIEFETYANVLVDLVELSPQNRQMIVEKINSVQSRGGTQIELGLKYGFEMLKKHKNRQSLKGIFFLSDGQDGKANVEDLFNTYKNDLGTFQIKSFGYGDDHDPRIMNAIASLKNGDFVYVKHQSEIEQIFKSAIVRLQRIGYENLQMEINFQDQFKGGQLLGDAQIQQNGDAKALLLINSLGIGQEKVYIQELIIPKSEQKKFMFKSQKVLDAKVRANDPKNDQNVEIQQKVDVEFVRDNDQIKKFNSQVLTQYVQKSAANEMKKATHQQENLVQIKQNIIKEVDKVEENIITILMDLGQKKDQVLQVVQQKTSEIKVQVEKPGNILADLYQEIQDLIHDMPMHMPMPKPESSDHFSQFSNIPDDPVAEKTYPCSCRRSIFIVFRGYPTLQVETKNNLKLNVYSAYDSIRQKDQEKCPLQVMISLQTFSGCLKRRPIDIFIIINTNSGMSGRLKSMKESIQKLIESLDNKDRFGLMKYDREANILIELQEIESQQKRQQIFQIIESLQSNPLGGTDVAKPLDLFSRMLDQIDLQPNRPFGMFWILDSMTNCSKSSLKNNSFLKLSNRINLCITTLGIGNDHDAKFLKQIALTRFGHYYYVGRDEDWRIRDIFDISLRGLTSVQFYETILHLKSCDDSVYFNLLDSDQNHQELKVHFGFLVEQNKSFDVNIIIPSKQVKQFQGNVDHQLFEVTATTKSLYSPDDIQPKEEIEEKNNFKIRFDEINQQVPTDPSINQSQQGANYEYIQSQRYEYNEGYDQMPNDQKQKLKRDLMEQQKLFVGQGQPDHRSINGWSWCQHILYLQQKRVKIIERTIYQRLLEKYEEAPTIFELGDSQQTSQLHVLSIDSPSGQQRDIQLNNLNYTILALKFDTKFEIYDEDWIPQIHKILSSCDYIQSMVIVHHEDSKIEQAEELYKKIRQHFRFDPENRLKEYLVNKIQTQCQYRTSSQVDIALQLLRNVVDEKRVIFVVTI